MTGERANSLSPESDWARDLVMGTRPVWVVRARKRNIEGDVWRGKDGGG